MTRHNNKTTQQKNNGREQKTKQKTDKTQQPKQKHKQKETKKHQQKTQQKTTNRTPDTRATSLTRKQTPYAVQELTLCLFTLCV